MAFKLILEGQGYCQQAVMTAPGEDDNESQGQEVEPSWHVQRGAAGVWVMVGVMGDKVRGEVKARPCKLRQAKKLVLCSGSNWGATPGFGE